MNMGIRAAIRLFSTVGIVGAIFIGFCFCAWAQDSEQPVYEWVDDSEQKIKLWRIESWNFFVATDPISDKEHILAILADIFDEWDPYLEEYKNLKLKYFREMFENRTMPFLAFQCKEEELLVFVNWDDTPSPIPPLDLNYPRNVILMFDDLPIRPETWRVTTDGDKVFAPDALAFMRRAVMHKTLRVAVGNGGWGNEETFRSAILNNLKGIHKVVMRMGRACNIPGDILSEH